MSNINGRCCLPESERKEEVDVDPLSIVSIAPLPFPSCAVDALPTRLPAPLVYSRQPRHRLDRPYTIQRRVRVDLLSRRWFVLFWRQGKGPPADAVLSLRSPLSLNTVAGPPPTRAPPNQTLPSRAPPTSSRLSLLLPAMAVLAASPRTQWMIRVGITSCRRSWGLGLSVRAGEAGCCLRMGRC